MALDTVLFEQCGLFWIKRHILLFTRHFLQLRVSKVAGCVQTVNMAFVIPLRISGT